MKLTKCPECGELIDIDLLEPLDLKIVIGCGLKEGAFTECEECGHNYPSKECIRIRDEDGWTPTTVKDYQDNG